MQLQTLITSLLASVALATPVRRDVQGLYTLRLSTPYAPLDGLYLRALAPPVANATAGLALGVTPSAKGESIVVYPVENPSSGLAELHTPEGGAVALVGRKGLLDLASILGDPAAAPVPEGATIDWTSFKLGDVGAGPLGFAARAGRWVAFPTPAKNGEPPAWGVKFKDNAAVTTENYVQVTILYEPLKSE
ncbi:hypothetical protein VTJ83DRAFT_622 [Remersonia thermophila]|uniref:Uncharacterized protein n=1 Tax=Remersonia thermophila TaxID=72144 RepID=A0ABR4DME6_9PEZI